MHFPLILVLAFSVFQNALSAQITATWKGGAPGRPNDWNCAANWRENRVPDEFSNVVVPEVSTTSFASPVIFSGEVLVNALFLAPNASLTVGKAAQLTVRGHEEDLSDGRVVVKGKLVLPPETMAVGMSTVALSQPKNR